MISLIALNISAAIELFSSGVALGVSTYLASKAIKATRRK